MSTENANESAFPFEYNSWEDNDLVRRAKSGMSKREYFAAMAMQGICATGITKEGTNHEYFAQQAVKIADELLKQLEQK